jgi:succinate-semialdehyde dehydrogenase / glutarate-semialdehyde dehydrogenase
MEYKMLINGVWEDAISGETWKVKNPATEEGIAEVPFGDAREAQNAIMAAYEAFPTWSSLTAYERGAILRRVGDLIREQIEALAPLTTRECGKPLAEARAEWHASADMFEWFAEEGKRAYGQVIPARKPGKRLLTVPEPVGVVATITAWNFPVYLPARKWSAALAAGCTVVGRPSELTPLSAMALANLLVEAGTPPGVINLVNGEPEPIGESFLSSSRVEKISFTGSQRVGSILMRGAANKLKRLSLELGGSAPTLIFGDADVDLAADKVVQAKLRNNGQACVSPSRIYVEQAIYEDFLAASQTRVESMVVGNGLQEGVTVGPLVTAAGRDKVESFVQDAVEKNAEVVTGGQRPAGTERGYFYQPTILTNVTPDMRVSCEEIFGPVMPVSHFSTFEEAISLANNTPYGLAAYVLTKDLATAVRSYERLRFGLVGINDLVVATAEGPFGGIKQSGFGREGAEEGLHEYLETKFVSMLL